MALKLFIGFLEASAGTSVLILLLFAFSPLLNRHFTPKCKYWIWLLLGIRLLLPVSLVLFRDSALYTVLQSLSIKETWWILGLWLIGIFVVFLYEVSSYRRFRHSALHWSVPVTRPEVVETASKLAAELGIAQPITILVSLKAPSPIMLGVCKPILLLPHEHYAENDLLCILRHELFHYQRHDIWYKLFLLIVKALHWFNPVIWLMSYLAGGDLEISCDFESVRNATNSYRSQYSEAILNTSHAFSSRKTPLSTYFYGGSATMRRRLKNLLNVRPRKTGSLLICVVVVLSFVGSGALSYAADAAVAQLALVPAASPVESHDTDLPAAASSEQPAEIIAPASSEVSSSEVSSSEVSSSEVSSSEVSSSEVFSSEVSSSEVSSSEVSSSEGSSSEVSSSEVSSSEASSSAAQKVVKVPGELPAKSHVLPVVQNMIQQYLDGTADTRMEDPEKMYMQFPSNLTERPSVTSEADFSLNVNNSIQGYGVVVPFADGNWQMHIWMRDDGPADEYIFNVVAVSFVQVNLPTE